MLCDDLRASCRIGAAAKASGGAGMGAAGGLNPNSKPSCWALVEGVGTPKRRLLSSVPSGNGAQLRRQAGQSRRDHGGGGGSGDYEENGGPYSRKRVFSK